MRVSFYNILVEIDTSEAMQCPGAAGSATHTQLQVEKRQTLSAKVKIKKEVMGYPQQRRDYLK